MKLFTGILIALVASLGSASKNSSSNKNKRGRRRRSMTLTVTNLSFQQPFSGFFVMVHDDTINPLYVMGEASSPELARLAEDGDPSMLEDLYDGPDGPAPGVDDAFVFNAGAPYFGGDTFEIEVEVSRQYPLVTIASMAINTNDCFVALNGVEVYNGMVVDAPGLDAGSEINNERCDSIPGPACAESTLQGNSADGEGEGFVHVHRGFFGLTDDLSEQGYDWRNPMMRVEYYLI
ncbi:MAG: hypothetical protein SGARI_001454 [Bacillariaceae sp.]